MFFAFCCIMAIVLLIVAIYIAFFMMTTISGAYWGYKEGEVQGLLYSGKYEIVSNENYSLNELKSFIKINGYYLKEVDDEQ